MAGPELVTRSSYIPRNQKEEKQSIVKPVAVTVDAIQKSLSAADKYREKQLELSGLLTNERFEFETDGKVYKMFERAPWEETASAIPNPLDFAKNSIMPYSKRVKPTPEALEFFGGEEGIMESLNQSGKFNPEDISNIVFGEDYSTAFEFDDTGKVVDVFPHKAQVGLDPNVDEFPVDEIVPVSKFIAKDDGVTIELEDIGPSKFGENWASAPSIKEKINESLDKIPTEKTASNMELYEDYVKGIQEGYSGYDMDTHTFKHSPLGQSRKIEGELLEKAATEGKFVPKTGTGGKFVPKAATEGKFLSGKYSPGYEPGKYKAADNAELFEALDSIGDSFGKKAGEVKDSLNKISSKGSKFIDKSKDAIMGKLGDKTAEAVSKTVSTASNAIAGYGIYKGGKRAYEGIKSGSPEEAVQGVIDMASPALIAAGPAGWAVLGVSFLEDLLYD